MVQDNSQLIKVSGVLLMVLSILRMILNIAVRIYLIFSAVFLYPSADELNSTLLKFFLSLGFSIVGLAMLFTIGLSMVLNILGIVAGAIAISGKQPSPSKGKICICLGSIYAFLQLVLMIATIVIFQPKIVTILLHFAGLIVSIVYIFGGVKLHQGLEVIRHFPDNGNDWRRR